MNNLGKYLIATGSVTYDPSKLYFLDKVIYKIKKLFRKKQLYVKRNIKGVELWQRIKM